MHIIERIEPDTGFRWRLRDADGRFRTFNRLEDAERIARNLEAQARQAGCADIYEVR